MKYLSTYLILFLMFLPLMLRAQDDWDKGGEIEDVEIEIVKDREIRLPEASRNFEKIPPMRINRERKPLEYFYNNINFNLPDLKVTMRPLRIRDSKLSKIYGNYIKAGYGNYSTPYAEAYFNSKRNRQYSYGAHFNYLNSRKGPVDGVNSGSGKMNIDLFGKYFTPKAVLSGDLGFDRRSFHFYGYPEDIEVDRDTLRQNFNNFYLKAGLENADEKADLNYFLGVRLDHLYDNKDATESDAMLTIKSRYDFNEEVFFRLNGDLEAIVREDRLVESNTRNLVRVRPSIGFEYEGFRIEAGFNAVYENDTVGDADKMHFYPTARASYPFSEHIELYAGIGGNIEKNTLKTLSEINPFIDANIPVYHTNKTFDFYGGINTKIGSHLGFRAGFNAANYKNMYFFINDPDDQSRFDIIYDTGNTMVFNMFTAINLSTSEKLRLVLRGDYWAYSTNLEEAWHKPSYRLSSIITYNLFEKILFTAEAYGLGGIKAYDIQTDDPVDLKALLDLNLKLDYRVSDQISLFLQSSNILGREYERFYHYPSRGLQFMGGFGYNF